MQEWEACGMLAKPVFPWVVVKEPLFKNISFLSTYLYNMCGYISHWGEKKKTPLSKGEKDLRPK